MYCVDTSLIIDILRGDKKLALKLQNLLRIHDVYISVITLCELYKGAYAHENSIIKTSDVKNIISSFELLSFNEKVCEEFGKMYAKLKKTGKIIPELDLLIASLIKANNLILATRDNKHFKNVDIKVEVW